MHDVLSMEVVKGFADLRRHLLAHVLVHDSIVSSINSKIAQGNEFHDDEYVAVCFVGLDELDNVGLSSISDKPYVLTEMLFSHD